MVALKVLAFVFGMAVVVQTLLSAILTFVLPPGVPVRLTGAVFRILRIGFNLVANRLGSYEERDRVMALYAPFALLILPLAWLILVIAGYMGMFWALGIDGAQHDFAVSGSSVFTLGFSPVSTVLQTALAFSEAGIGLLLIALLIAYLPTMYTSWSRREAGVAQLEVRAGSPPSALEMITRFNQLERLERMHDLWPAWETWFMDIEESHTSLAPLTFFRSPQPQRSWVTAAGAVLDTASFVASSLDEPRNAQAELCIRAGFLALRRIADFFQLPLDPIPEIGAEVTISISREEYVAMYDQLAAQGVRLKPDRERAWHDFRGWRVNYDMALLGLARLTMAPYAPWSSDRSLAISKRQQWRQGRGFGPTDLPESQRVT